MENYSPFKLTALKRKTLSVPMRELLNRGIFKGKCIDFACGYGDDFRFLTHRDIDIVGYDKYNLEFKNDELLKDTYDILTCNYCFNVISKQEHKELLEQIKKLSENIYISVRADSKAIKDTWIYIEEYDCWSTSKGSYQRFYTEDNVKEYFGEVEYLINNSNLKLFKLKLD